MGKPLIGEVVVVPFPQTDLQPGKRRPALVVANLTGDDLILCQITTQSRRDAYSVSITSTDFERGHLNVDSFIRPNRLFTVDQAVIAYTAAKIQGAKLDEVRAKIRQLFSCLCWFLLCFCFINRTSSFSHKKHKRHKTLTKCFVPFVLGTEPLKFAYNLVLFRSGCFGNCQS